MTMAIAFPNIDPVIFSFGPISIRWYALSYIAGLLIGIKYISAFVSKPPHAMGKKDAEDLLIWLTLGVILGGRIGYVGFYNLEFYTVNPLAILKVWEGGMSFHGGLIGVVGATILFCRQRKLNILAVGDAIACATPFGLFFGRIANFINGELFGRVSDVPWAMIFPYGGELPRHPSQLYEAFFEGILLFVILFLLSQNERLRHRGGFLSGFFMVGYAFFRGFIEFFREPDSHIGFLYNNFTTGQVLSVPLVLLGAYLMYNAKRLD
ncbi:MAG: prolipoprotein diacylglyceryl transferase [Pseudomonadota bacterium]|nr:prolipoprotein diacylglyceryl transferase [Pseudomonadota bacterium]